MEKQKFIRCQEKGETETTGTRVERTNHSGTEARKN